LPDYLRENQEFFGPRAAGWEDRFPGDEPQFQRAIDELGVPTNGRAIDVGCGTGRALPLLRAAVGERGVVLGLDATPEMLAEARRLGREQVACLLLGDAHRLPLADASLDAILAAGLVPHLTNPAAGLSELARVTRPGGRLAIFHPISRAVLAARHGGTPSDDDALSPKRLPKLLDGAGWQLDGIDDGNDRYLALATRQKA
jgi:SAM-dependent methyltransferase